MAELYAFRLHRHGIHGVRGAVAAGLPVAMESDAGGGKGDDEENTVARDENKPLPCTYEEYTKQYVCICNL